MVRVRHFIRAVLVVARGVAVGNAVGATKFLLILLNNVIMVQRLTQSSGAVILATAGSILLIIYRLPQQYIPLPRLEESLSFQDLFHVIWVRSWRILGLGSLIPTTLQPTTNKIQHIRRVLPLRTIIRIIPPQVIGLQ